MTNTSKAGHGAAARTPRQPRSNQRAAPSGAASRPRTRSPINIRFDIAAQPEDADGREIEARLIIDSGEYTVGILKHEPKPGSGAEVPYQLFSKPLEIVLSASGDQQTWELIDALLAVAEQLKPFAASR